MKRFFVLTLLALFSFSLSAQKIFFPSKEGTKLVYENYDAKGKTTGKVLYTIREVKKTGDDMDITYKIEMLNASEEEQYIDEVTIQKRGDQMIFDMSKFLNKSAFPQQEGAASAMEVTGNNMELPLVPVPGTSLSDANVQISMKMGFINLKMSANVTNRKVEAVEEISVKGKSFNAFKITSDISSNVLGVKVNAKSAEWYAYNLGVVKTVNYNKKGEIESTMELVEIVE